MSLQEDAKRILPFVQALADGKTVEQRLFVRGNMASGGWFLKGQADGWSSAYEYRIKPEKKWRPYTREEFIEKCLGKPLRSKFNGDVVMVTIVSNSTAWTAEFGEDPWQKKYDIEDTVNQFTHLDGSPLGVEVEE